MKKAAKLTVILLLLAAIVLAAVLIGAARTRTQYTIANGTTYRLIDAIYTNFFNYTRRDLPGWLEPLAPVIPDQLEAKLSKASGSIGLGRGGMGGTNRLMLVMDGVNSEAMPTEFQYLRIRDEEGNIFDGNMLAGGVGNANRLTYAYLLQAFPKRTERLFVELLILQNGGWTNIGPFKIKNPQYDEYPQWEPQPLPQSKGENELTVTLTRFESGPGSPHVTDGAPNSVGLPHSTLVSLEFMESGVPTTDYRIQGLNITDATGNSIVPVFMQIMGGLPFSWVKGGDAEFIGNLWPGENAWKLSVDVIRTAGFNEDIVWDVPAIPLPPTGTSTDLGLTFHPADEGWVKHLPVILAPGAKTAQRPWSWLLQYPGEETNVYAVALSCPNFGGRRAVIVDAKSETGRDFQIMFHHNSNEESQGIFVQPPSEGAQELHLQIAFPELKTFEFIARPEFVERIEP